MNFYSKVSMLIVLAIEIPLFVFGGFYIGDILDEKAGTPKIFMSLGIIVALYLSWQTIKRMKDYLDKQVQ